MIKNDGDNVTNTCAYDVTKINKITHANIAHSRIYLGRCGMDIGKVAASFGLAVHDYNKAVDNTVSYCKQNATSFIELRG